MNILKLINSHYTYSKNKYLANNQTKPNNNTNRYGNTSPKTSHRSTHASGYFRISNSTHASGFTIIELLIVIVIIGILVAITSVAYTGLTKQSRDASLQSGIKQVHNQLAIIQTNTGSYPSSINEVTDLPSTPSSTYQYILHNPQSYCLTITNTTSNQSQSTTQDGTIQPGLCMQHFTRAQCDSLPIYNGTNKSAIINTIDNRDNTTRTYKVGRLADNNCWMLDNLKLGSTTSTVTLTNQNTDLNNKVEFVLPKVNIPVSSSYSTPVVIGPIPGDTGQDESNFGHLYNWTAVTAGETVTSHISGAGEAPNSICALGWRPPTGSSQGEFSMLNAKMRDPNATQPSMSTSEAWAINWEHIGPFMGVLAGQWNGTFSNPGIRGYIWSSTPYSSNDDAAFYAHFYTGYVNTSYGAHRANAYGLRCILN